jgi:hypothetical protein
MPVVELRKDNFWGGRDALILEGEEECRRRDKATVSTTTVKRQHSDQLSASMLVPCTFTPPQWYLQ